MISLGSSSMAVMATMTRLRRSCVVPGVLRRRYCRARCAVHVARQLGSGKLPPATALHWNDIYLFTLLLAAAAAAGEVDYKCCVAGWA